MLDRKESAFRLGIEQFNGEEFFAAHETWEAIWLGSSGDDRIFLQGIIQLAAAFYHWRRGNPQGALSLLRRGLEKLAGSPRSYRGICVERLRQQAAAFAETLSGGPVDQPVRLPRIELETAPRGGRNP